MPHSNVPSRLRYLQPVLELVDKVPAGQLNEDVDTSALETMFRQRIEGLPSAKARRVLSKDIKAMASWLNKPGVEQPAAHFILGWLMGAKGELLGSGDLVTSLVDSLSDLPPAPPGRQFGALPEIGPGHSTLLDEGGNVYLYIRNNATEPSPVDVRVKIDGTDGVWDIFDRNYNVFTCYRLRLPQGEHHLVVESERGQARLEEDVSVNGILHIAITYWYSEPSRVGPELPPQLTLHAEHEPWLPNHLWREKE